MRAHGHVFKYGDNVDTDVIIPARYLNSFDAQELASHAMADIDPDFVKKVFSVLPWFILFFKCFAHIIARFPIRTQSFPVVHRVSFCRSHCTPTHGSDPLILFPLPVPGSC